MKNLLNPKWLLVLNTLPIAILFLIFIGDFNIIKTLLDEKTIGLWENFGLILLIISTTHLLFTLITIFRKKTLNIFYGITALIIYTCYLYIYLFHSDHIVPRNIPRWMLSGELVLYVGTFLMPTLAHALFVTVIKLTSKNKEYQAWKSFLATISIPLLWFVFAQIIMPMAHRIESNFSEHILIIVMVIGVLLFLFFLIRTIYILSVKKSKVLNKYQLLWKIPITLIFPILGLLVNQGFLINSFSGGNSFGVFGDFSNPWFSIIAIINGVLLCLPITKNKNLRLLLFVARSITFAYTFYFFLVFLPFLPLSIVAIIAIGVGFLMLTPLVLFVIHIQELAKDFKYLKQFFNTKVIALTTIVSFMVIPTFTILSFVSDKNTLHNTLDYIYNPEYTKSYAINKSSLKNTISKVLSNKDSNRDLFLGSQTPYLSPIFNWIVLDNLTLSNSKINTIERVFFNEKSFGIRNPRSENIRNTNVNISNISSRSKYNKEDNSWTSWIDLEITNGNSDRFSEYATTIDLPDGCWINDYYLYVGDTLEKGLLAEKKSAMWVFSQIRNENRDPGLLYYLTGNKVAFRIFPFLANEVRKTGIQFIHKEPLTLNIDNHEIYLGNTEEQLNVTTIESDHVVYVSSKEKSKLEKVNRIPYLHFIVDTSKDNAKNVESYIKVIDSIKKSSGISKEQSKISFTNSYTTTTDWKTDWKTKLEKQTFEGGFYLDRAIKTVLYNSYKELSNRYPIIIAVSNDLEKAVLPKDFQDLKITYPDNHWFYNLSLGGDLTKHDLNINPKKIVSINQKINTQNTVLVWPNKTAPKGYLPITNNPSLLLKNTLFNVDDSTIKTNHWTSGLELQSKWISSKLNPKVSEKDWNTSVKHSFQSKIMTPLTSYIVVENEAQKAILKKKQKQVLAGKNALDLSEDAQRMSEPQLLLLLLLLLCFIIIKRYKGLLFKPKT